MRYVFFPVNKVLDKRRGHMVVLCQHVEHDVITSNFIASCQQRRQSYARRRHAAAQSPIVLYRVGQKPDCFWKFDSPLYVDTE